MVQVRQPRDHEAVCVTRQESNMPIDLDRPYPLSAQQIADYRRDGFIKLK